MTNPPTSNEHKFIPGVVLWGQRLCKECYRPFYFDCHKPSFGTVERDKQAEVEQEKQQS